MTKINKTEYLTDSTLFTNHTSLAVDQQMFDNPEQFIFSLCSSVRWVTPMLVWMTSRSL